MVERIGRKWQVSTMDQEIKDVAERDWDGFLEFIAGLLEILMPLFDMCPTDTNKVKGRAAAWVEAMDGGRKARRALGIRGRMRLALWRRAVNRELGPEVNDEIDNVELQRAILQVTAEAEPEELTQLRAEADRAKDEAA
jgi:hypothetical protein